MARRKKFGHDLRLLREKAGVGIKTVGKAINVSYTHISRIENGHKPPSTELIGKLAAYYGIDEEEMLARIGALPDDIQQLIEENGKEVFDLIRSSYSGKVRRGPT